jgi:hypothetical protein
VLAVALKSACASGLPKVRAAALAMKRRLSTLPGELQRVLRRGHRGAVLTPVHRQVSPGGGKPDVLFRCLCQRCEPL